MDKNIITLSLGESKYFIGSVNGVEGGPFCSVPEYSAHENPIFFVSI